VLDGTSLHGAFVGAQQVRRCFSAVRAYSCLSLAALDGTLSFVASNGDVLQSLAVSCSMWRKLGSTRSQWHKRC